MAAAHNQPKHYQTEFGPGPEMPIPGGEDIPNEDLRDVISAKLGLPTSLQLKHDELVAAAAAAKAQVEQKERAERERLYAERMRIPQHDVTGKLAYVKPELYHPLSYPACPQCGHAMQLFFSSDAEPFTDANGSHAQGGVFQCACCQTQQSGIVRVKEMPTYLQLEPKIQENIAFMVADHNRRFEEERSLNATLRITFVAAVMGSLIFVLVPIIIHLTYYPH